MIIRPSLRTAALAAALMSLLPVVAIAQEQESSAGAAATGRHNKSTNKEAAAKILYPKATRAEPRTGDSKLEDKLVRLNQQIDAKKDDEALVSAEAILADSKANNSDRALAAYYAGFAVMDKTGGNRNQAIVYFQRALSENALPNNVHYAVMLNLAQLQINEQRYAEALATAQRFLSETQSEDVNAYAVVGNAQYRLGHYPEAAEALKKVLTGNSTDVNNDSVAQMLIDCYQQMKQPAQAAALAEQLAAKSPDDKNTQMLVASIYANAGQPDKASAIFANLRSKGLLTESKDYESSYRLLYQIGGRPQDIVALINEGLDKKILTPSADAYSLLGQSYYDLHQMPQAIAAWEKGAPLAEDGEIYLNLAKVDGQNGQAAAAKTAAHQAIAKGVDHPGEAWLEIARAESMQGNKPAMVAAYREAAKDPQTRSQANKLLQQSGAK